MSGSSQAGLSTQLVHHPYQAPATFRSPQPGVFKASTVFFDNVAAMRSTEWKDKSGYTYGLYGTPTTYQLEERLCTLEGGQQCLLVPSGLAAIATVTMALLKTGDEILLPDNTYDPAKAFVAGELASWGISHRFFDPMDMSDLRAKISARTALVWLEAAGSVTLEFPDLLAQVALCRAQGVLCALDNTWGAGIALRPFDLDPSGGHRLAVDVSVHALTKYPSGGGDVLMGSIITTDPALGRRIKQTHMRLGLTVGGNDAEAILRGLPSILLRYQAHDVAARELAGWCESQVPIAQVLHPALPGSPGHAHWLRTCQHGPGGAAGLFSVVFGAAYGTAQVDAFCDALVLFKLGYSWGGPVSLVVPYDLTTMRVAWPAGIVRGTVVRFSVGFEAVADLRADLAQALQVMLD